MTACLVFRWAGAMIPCGDGWKHATYSRGLVRVVVDDEGVRVTMTRLGAVIARMMRGPTRWSVTWSDVSRLELAGATALIHPVRGRPVRILTRHVRDTEALENAARRQNKPVEWVDGTLMRALRS